MDHNYEASAPQSSARQTGKLKRQRQIFDTVRQYTPLWRFSCPQCQHLAGNEASRKRSTFVPHLPLTDPAFQTPRRADAIAPRIGAT